MGKWNSDKEVEKSTWADKKLLITFLIGVILVAVLGYFVYDSFFIDKKFKESQTTEVVEEITTEEEKEPSEEEKEPSEEEKEPSEKEKLEQAIDEELSIDIEVSDEVKALDDAVTSTTNAAREYDPDEENIKPSTDNQKEWFTVLTKDDFEICGEEVNVTYNSEDLDKLSRKGKLPASGNQKYTNFVDYSEAEGYGAEVFHILDGDGFMTSRDIRVGSTLKDIVEAYGDDYGYNGHGYSFFNKDGKESVYRVVYGYQFTDDNGVDRSFHLVFNMTGDNHVLSIHFEHATV